MPYVLRAAATAGLFGAAAGAEASVCELPHGVTGNCRAAVPRWTFNSGRCEQFTWGGCEMGSNANRFETEAACNAQCAPVEHNCLTRELWSQEKRDWCCEHQSLGCPVIADGAPVPPVIADGTPVHNCLTRELWSQEKRDWCCEHQSLGCPVIADGAPVPPVIADGTPVHHNCLTREQWSQEKRDWCCATEGLGCPAIADGAPVPPVIATSAPEHNCLTRELWSQEKRDWCCDNMDLGCPAEIETDVCAQPIVVGPCRAAHRRYAYDTTKGKCVRFTYGGCQGNDNRFETKRACKQACHNRDAAGGAAERVEGAKSETSTGFIAAIVSAGGALLAATAAACVVVSRRRVADTEHPAAVSIAEEQMKAAADV